MKIVKSKGNNVSAVVLHLIVTLTLENQKFVISRVHG